MGLWRRGLALFLSWLLLLPAAEGGFAQQADQSTPGPPVQPAQQTPEQLQQLVAPIALYPDALIAQILAAATYPAQVVEADRWMQQNSNLKGQELADGVDKQDWDPSVKALTQFPSVLANMDKNLDWTSSLGDAYVSQQQDVMSAIREMRERAKDAGNLKSSDQENVTTQGQTIVIEPASPDVVYVPEYDPWVVYGAPVVAWAGWYPYPGLYLGGPGIAFGIGFSVGFFGGFGWGWHNWGFDWGHRTVVFNHNTYISHSRTFVDRDGFRAGSAGFDGRGVGGGTHGFAGEQHGFAGEQHGSAAPHAQPGLHSGAFSGFDRGATARSYSSRGQSSFGGGAHGGGGRR